jgi:hypothetical protein
MRSGRMLHWKEYQIRQSSGSIVSNWCKKKVFEVNEVVGSEMFPIAEARPPPVFVG